ncbi:TPA: putative mucin/carbohydrate-binding domain-containing protein [Enterococcus faecium]
MCKKRKQLKLISLLGLGLFIGGLGCSTNAFAMERHAAYLERNYADKQGIMHHLTTQGHVMAEKEFTNTIDPYTDYHIADAFNTKQAAIAKLNAAFKNSKDEDINYLVIESHGWTGGLIDISFQELKNILDQYKGHFVINIMACESGGAINRIQIPNALKTPKNKMGEFENSRYTVFCSSSKTQFSYGTSDYAFFTKAYFDSSQISENGFLNADYNQDNVVTASELGKYLETNGKAGNSTPVSQIPEPNLPVFATNRSTFDFNGVGTRAGKDTHFAQLKYNGDHTATLKEGVEMYGCPIHPYFEGIYASILAKDKDGNTLFTKEFKGTDYVQAKEENFSLPEGATLTLYHAEGTSRRYETSNDKELKQNAVGNTYYYVVKNGILSQQVNKQEFNFLGLGDYKFAQLDVVNGVAKLDSKYTQYGSHCYFKDNVYASVVVNDLTGKEVFKKEYKGDKNTPAGLDNIELKEGYTLTIHHEEPSRLKTNDDTNLHKKSSKDFHYTFTNGYLVEQ